MTYEEEILYYSSLSDEELLQKAEESREPLVMELLALIEKMEATIEHLYSEGQVDVLPD